jgi:hypothetical protein
MEIDNRQSQSPIATQITDLQGCLLLSRLECNRHSLRSTPE